METYDNLTVELAGSNLIEASAGTGKTFAIACLYLRLVVEQGLLPENVLVVTFTEAATKELKTRVRERLCLFRDFSYGIGKGDEFSAALLNGANPWWPGREAALERVENAVRTFDCAAISTIHGFCSRALQENAFESGSLYDTELVPDQTPLIREIVDDFWRVNFFGDDAPLLATVLRKKWLHDEMLRFLRGKLANPDLEVMPLFDRDQEESLSRRCHALYDSLVASWHADRAELENILVTHKGLSRAKDKYRADMVPGLLAAMDSYLAVGNPFELFEGIEKFSSDFMESQALKREAPPRHEFFNRCGELLDLVDKRFIALKGSLFRFARQRLSRLKSDRNIRFYDDLLTDLYLALEGPSGSDLAARLRERYRAALIDEFQDTDPVQYRIFREIFGSGPAPLFLIGDPKQAIYSFRGADIFAYLEAKDDVPARNRFTMDRNWRSAPEMVESLNILFRQREPRPFLFSAIGYPGVSAAREERPLVLAGRDSAPLQVWFLGRGDDDGPVIAIGTAKQRIVRMVADEIAGLLADGRRGAALLDGRGILPGDIAVIVRSHDQAGLVQDALRARRIPAVVQSTASLFVTREAREVRRVLEAVDEPSREALVRAALATSLFGMSGNDIALLDDDDQAWEERLASFRNYHDLWRDRGFMVFFRTLLSREGVRERVLSREGGERSMTNFLHCAEVLHQAATEDGLGLDALRAWFGERVSVPPENEECQIRLESDEKAVRIVTIHVSKGLEYPIVFCPFSWGGVMETDDTVVCHDGYRMVVDFGSDDFERHRIAARNEALAENIRLLYVALTRAKYRCYLVWGRFRYTESSAPAYLLHYPDDVIDDAVQRLSGTMKMISDDEMAARLQGIVTQGPGRVAVSVDPEPAVETGVLPVEEEFIPEFVPFRGIVAGDWRVMSFTSFAAGHREGVELPDRDQGTAAAASEPDVASEPTVSLVAFPKGAAAGIFFHAVFEQLDFTGAHEESLELLVESLLARHGFDPCWLEPVCGLVRDIMVTPIPVADGTLCLGSVDQRDRIVEMEFFFPLSFVESKKVAGILARWSSRDAGTDLRAVAERLSFGGVRGMVRGFIDLVFRHDGKYYLADWKSNYLGTLPADYCRDRLADEMDNNLYHLQYLLYLVALNRYLEMRDPSYRYADHFGGVLYLFIRGMNAGRPGSGVFYEVPPEGLVRELTDCLIEHERELR